MERRLDFEGLVKKTKRTIIRQFCLSVVIAYIIPISAISVDFTKDSQQIGHELFKVIFNVFSWIYICISLLIILTFNIRRFFKTIKNEMDIVYHQSIWLSSNNSSSSLTLHEFIETNKRIELMQQKIKNMIEIEKHQKEDVLFRVSAMAHDLKTPLTVIKGNSELLQLVELSEVDQQCVKDIEKASSQLENYFNQLINYSKTLYDEEVVLNKFNVKNLEKIIQQECIYLIGEKIDYEYTSYITTDFKVNIDLDLLIRSVTNIINNAIFYADDSRKFVKITLSDDSRYLIIGIWNNGSEFSEDVLSNFGKLFYREDISRTSQLQHFGIGLAFVKQVMDRHSGELVLKNTNPGALVEILVPKSIV